MKLVMDTLFLECLEFNLPASEARAKFATSMSLAEGAERACAAVGLELIDYDRLLVLDDSLYGSGSARLRLTSKAWRERLESRA